MKKKLLQALLFLWQLPQNALALFLIALMGAEKKDIITSRAFFQKHKKCFLFKVWEARRFNAGWGAVSLGAYILAGDKNALSYNTLAHEKGHQVQSRRLGWLYLLVIGLPSVCGNLYDRMAHRHWTSERRRKWYYSLPWEKSADKLGGAIRSF